MSSESRNKREQLKKQYKKHYRKMREAKDRLRRTQKTKKITTALKDMDTTDLMASFDSFLFEVKSTVAHAEAKLDVALEGLEEKDFSPSVQTDEKGPSSEQRVKETLKQLKNEMGLLYSEVERRAETLEVQKTVGQSEEPKVTEK